MLHRLNRAEYANAIRELLAVDVDVATMLPSDDSAEGFDNISDVLGASPTLIQAYLSAAMKISRLAVGDLEALRPESPLAAGRATVSPQALRAERSFVTPSHSMRSTKSRSLPLAAPAEAAGRPFAPPTLS